MDAKVEYMITSILFRLRIHLSGLRYRIHRCLSTD